MGICKFCICVHFHFTTEIQVCDEHYVVNRVLAKFVLITKTIDVTCKQAMVLVAWKQENVKQNTDGDPTIILKVNQA
jgi:hypothetical protein